MQKRYTFINIKLKNNYILLDVTYLINAYLCDALDGELFIVIFFFLNLREMPNSYEINFCVFFKGEKKHGSIFEYFNFLNGYPLFIIY